jgi:hypothetical protein
MTADCETTAALLIVHGRLLAVGVYDDSYAVLVSHQRPTNAADIAPVGCVLSGKADSNITTRIADSTASVGTETDS